MITHARWILTVCLTIPLLAGITPARAQRHYVFFNLERERIRESSFLDTDAFVGAQLKYTWRELEPEKDRYDVDLILRDLAFLQSRGKKLFVQLQDMSFSEKRVNVPEYLRTDPKYGGGAELMLEFTDDSETEPIAEGWIARRWDPAVQERFAKLLATLGQALDGKIEGINLPESSTSTWRDRPPKGYTYESYRDGIKANMKAAREAFPKSIVLQYANFMPGEWLPWDDRGYLKSIYAYAAEIGVAVGGPDLMPYRRGQLHHSYPLISSRPDPQIAGVAVQWGNYDQKVPATGKVISISELHAFARDDLRLNYLFWGTQEPHYSERLLPYLRKTPRRDMSRE